MRPESTRLDDFRKSYDQSLEKLIEKLIGKTSLENLSIFLIGADGFLFWTFLITNKITEVAEVYT